MTDKKVESTSEETVAQKIWNDIKDIDLQMFSLPNQKVNQYCTPISIEPSKLFLTTTVTSTLPALEAVLPSKYMIECHDRFLIVSLVKSDKK